MDFFSFDRSLREKGIVLFSLEDAEALSLGTSRKTVKNNLFFWASKKRITSLKRNLYVVSDLLESIPDFHIANRLYAPSYVSLEAALSFYGVLPEEASHVTSITTKPTRTFKNRAGVFNYKSIQPKAYTGYRIVRIQGYSVLLADREKALADYAYFRMRRNDSFTPEDRLNLGSINLKKAEKYASLFNTKTRKAIESLEDLR